MAQGPLNSIREYIPLTDQTNPNKFPAKEYQPYPYMPTKSGEVQGRPALIPYKTQSGQHVVVHDEDEEAAFRAEHPEASDRLPAPAAMQDELAALRAENARLKKAAQGEPKQPDDDKPKGGVAALVKPDTARTAPKTGKKLD